MFSILIVIVIHEHMRTRQKQAKSRELLKLSNDLLKRAGIVFTYINDMVL